MNPEHKSTVSLFLTIIAAVVAMTLYISRVEAKAEAAATQAAEANVAVRELTGEIRKQREIMADLQGDTRALLQLLRLRPSP